jgi:rubrerythrin
MNAEEVINLAIRKEIEAYELYTGVMERVDNPGAARLLKDLAEQEAYHRRLLEGLPPEQAGQFTPPREEQRHISEYLESRPLGPESSLQDVLIHAMEREEAASQFYSTMADSVDEAELRSLLEKLSTMEEAHEARLEDFYEDVFLKEM